MLRLLFFYGQNGMECEMRPWTKYLTFSPVLPVIIVVVVVVIPEFIISNILFLLIILLKQDCTQCVFFLLI